jgi:hypothetical protein
MIVREGRRGVSGARRCDSLAPSSPRGGADRSGARLPWAVAASASAGLSRATSGAVCPMCERIARRMCPRGAAVRAACALPLLATRTVGPPERGAGMHAVRLNRARGTQPLRKQMLRARRAHTAAGPKGARRRRHPGGWLRSRCGADRCGEVPARKIARSLRGEVAQVAHCPRSRALPGKVALPTRRSPRAGSAQAG